MSTPTLELLPLKPAVRNDGPVTLVLLVRITPSSVSSANATRPPLNLGLVLDRSGSMAGRKLEFARQAAAYAVEQLLPADRVSVTAFDDRVKVAVPSTTAENKAAILHALGSVEAGGTTALFDGWLEGTRQVGRHLVPGGINRVLLLTDGLANVGEVRPEVITGQVKDRCQDGVSTTALGVGRDYNEDLLERMARSGDGNYYFIETPRQLPDVYQSELRGLMATVGRCVRLSLEPGAGVRVSSVLNDLDRDAEGRLVLPNLLIGMPVEVVLRLDVEASQDARPLLGVHVSWDNPHQGLDSISGSLSLPAVTGPEWESLADDEFVRERAALQVVGRHKRFATRFLERGDEESARAWLARARALLDSLPTTPEVELEERALEQVEAHLDEGDLATTTKLAKFQHYNRSNSRTQIWEET